MRRSQDGPFLTAVCLPLSGDMLEYTVEDRAPRRRFWGLVGCCVRLRNRLQ